MMLDLLTKALNISKPHSKNDELLLIVKAMSFAVKHERLLKSNFPAESFDAVREVFKLSNKIDLIDKLVELKDLVHAMDSQHGWAIYKAWLAKQEGK